MRNVFKRTRCTSLGQSTPGDPNEVGPPQRRPPCAEVPNRPIVTVQSADQLRQLRLRIGPETRDNAVKGAYQGQDGRQVSPQKSGPTPGTHERHGHERAQRSEEHTSELQSQSNLVCRLLLEKKKKKQINIDMCRHEAPE